MNFYFFEREVTEDCEAGFTVSKKADLPEGDFSITEYSWHYNKLWFVDKDEFTANERQAAYLAILQGQLSTVED